jgi:hypothetical protein
MPKKIPTEEAKEVEREDVPLDEAPVENESQSPPDSREVEYDEEEAAAPSDGEGPRDDKPSGAKPKRHLRRGLRRFLLNKWLLIPFAGIISGVVGIMLGYDMPSNPQSGGQKSAGIHGEAAKQGKNLVDTGLQPFFVPLPEGSKNIAVKLVIKVRWESESLEKYKGNATVIRNNLLTYFLTAAKSKGGLEADRSRLESEIGKVLDDSLAVKDIKVSLESVTPI